MQVILKIVTFIIKYGSLIIAIVRDVETLITGTGEEKKAAAMSMVRATLESRGILWNEQLEYMVSGAIDFIVAALNALKAWRNK